MNRSELSAVPVLLHEVGLVETVRLSWDIDRAKAADEPFGALPEPTNERERLSREQIGPAIILYRLLQRSRSREEALRISRAVVTESAVVFLRQSVGRLDREVIESLDEAGRARFVRERGEKFFNATVRWDAVESDHVAFTVTRCTFPRLCQAVGVPELAPVFCAGDGKFFGSEGAHLERPYTIAEGADTCPFSIRWE